MLLPERETSVPPLPPEGKQRNSPKYGSGVVQAVRREPVPPLLPGATMTMPVMSVTTSGAFTVLVKRIFIPIWISAMLGSLQVLFMFGTRAICSATYASVRLLPTGRLST